MFYFLRRATLFYPTQYRDVFLYLFSRCIFIQKFHCVKNFHMLKLVSKPIQHTQAQPLSTLLSGVNLHPSWRSTPPHLLVFQGGEEMGGRGGLMRGEGSRESIVESRECLLCWQSGVSVVVSFGSRNHFCISSRI